MMEPFFFSSSFQFYHACDQPGVTVMCIMDYDTLQYCDFLGSVCSIWVTLLCMARITDTIKYVRPPTRGRCLREEVPLTGVSCVQALFILGTLLIAMSMQLDRKGLWNLLGPILCALLIMVAAWVSPALSSKRVCDLLVFFLKRPMSSHNSAGVSRGASAALLPAVMETLGLLPHPRRRLRPDWDLPVHLRRDGRQLLLHPLAVAHPGGQLRGVSAAP